MRKGTGILSIMQSVLAAAFGVQSSKNKDRDFQDGKPAYFLIAGLLGTVGFISAVFLVVKVVLSNAG